MNVYSAVLLLFYVELFPTAKADEILSPARELDLLLSAETHLAGLRAGVSVEDDPHSCIAALLARDIVCLGEWAAVPPSDRLKALLRDVQADPKVSLLCVSNLMVSPVAYRKAMEEVARRDNSPFNNQFGAGDTPLANVSHDAEQRLNQRLKQKHGTGDVQKTTDKKTSESGDARPKKSDQERSKDKGKQR